MTSGGDQGTSGGRRFHIDWTAVIAIAAVCVLVVLVNATSRLIESEAQGRALDVREPFVWEISSVLTLLALTPAIGWAIARWPPRRETLVRFFAIHAALTLPFSVIHVAGMVALRKLAYAAAGHHYEFSHGRLPLAFLYEYRKDVLVYAALAATLWVFRWRADEAAKKASAGVDRIEIRDGATARYLAPAEIAWVEAAGNYVEFNTPGGVVLVRGTLSAWEEKLAPLGFVRAHRSRIVNRARIRALKPTPAGDVAITLDDGREIAGSRRYREGLEAS
ncbi:MAG: LytTR family DNA-binding domain-containing protein [Hyphomonadaceae bacterium]